MPADTTDKLSPRAFYYHFDADIAARRQQRQANRLSLPLVPTSETRFSIRILSEALLLRMQARDSSPDALLEGVRIEKSRPYPDFIVACRATYWIILNFGNRQESKVSICPESRYYQKFSVLVITDSLYLIPTLSTYESLIEAQSKDCRDRVEQYLHASKKKISIRKRVIESCCNIEKLSAFMISRERYLITHSLHKKRYELRSNSQNTNNDVSVHKQMFRNAAICKSEIMVGVSLRFDRIIIQCQAAFDISSF